MLWMQNLAWKYFFTNWENNRSESSGWSFTEMQLWISCDFILLSCQNSSDDVPENMCKITHRFRHFRRNLFLPQWGRNQKVTSGGEDKAAWSTEGGLWWAAPGWLVLQPLQTGLSLWCGCLFPGQVKDSCTEDLPEGEECWHNLWVWNQFKHCGVNFAYSWKCVVGFPKHPREAALSTKSCIGCGG